MLKLECVNCGAPLEITADMELVACGYCATSQRVKRKGGTVSLQHVETAIKAVQRGTDRTAAELALPRLERELSEARQERAAILAAETQRIESLKRGRRYLTLIAFLAFFLGGPPLLMGPSIDEAESIATTASFMWFAGCVIVPVFVYKKTKIPPAQSSERVAEVDARIRRCLVHIQANRKILDQLPPH